MSNSENVVPNRTSLEWSPYVLSLLDESEMRDGRPLVHGLRRVSKILLGEVLKSGPVQSFPAIGGDVTRAAVVYRVIFKLEDGSEVEYSDVADCSEDNADTLVALHPSATASTRAEARALRKALGLTCVSAEEITSEKDIVSDYRAKKPEPTDGGMKSEDIMSVNQKRCIAAICDKIKVDPVKIVKHLAGKDVDSLTKGEASKVIDSLSGMQNGSVEIPKV